SLYSNATIPGHFPHRSCCARATALYLLGCAGLGHGVLGRTLLSHAVSAGASRCRVFLGRGCFLLGFLLLRFLGLGGFGLLHVFRRRARLGVGLGRRVGL